MATDIRRSATVNRDRQAVYAFWREYANHPRFVPDLVSVEDRGAGVSHWVAKGPGGREITWDATMTVDEPGRRIGWQSTPASEQSNRGEVTFRDAPGGRGTEVIIAMSYDAPLGAVGRTVAKLFRDDPDQQVRDALRGLKQILEAGEIPTTEGQSSGRVPDEERRIAEQIRERFNEQFRSDNRGEEASA